MAADAVLRDAALADARRALQRGDAAAAETLCRRALESNERDATAWSLLGTALRHRDVAAAEDALRRALALDAGSVDARFHLANLLRTSERHREAIAEYRTILASSPAHPSVLNNLGLALFADGELRDAERIFGQILAIDPDHAQALVNLVHLLCRERRHAEALQHGARYLRRHGDAPAEFWIDVGICRHAALEYDAAIDCFEHALTSDPRDAVALVNLAQVLIDAARYAEAASALRRAHATAPHDLQAAALLAYCQQHLCDWAGLDDLHAQLADEAATTGRGDVSPFVALSMPLAPARLQRLSQQWAARIPTASLAAPAIIEERGTRLRVGYLSSDFRVHALAFLATEVWERHDRTRVATFGYAIGPPDASPLRRRIRAAFETFRDLHDMPALAAAQRIADDRLDVLIDLNGYTTHARSEIVAARPAPVQVQWLGYLGTMGAPWMNYVITDRYVSPREMQPYFDEQFLYLPDCYCPSDTRRIPAAPPGRAACGLPEDAIVLCCFNASYKLLPAVFAAWMRVLSASPASVLWLADPGDPARANLARSAAAHNIDPARLVFAPRAPIDLHLARHAHVDLFLDTHPYNAGTAANDALFMGVPVLTCSGSTMASRVAGSQLHAIGLPSLVVGSLAEYEARAIELAGDRRALRDLRETLAGNRARYPLFDMARFVQGLEDALMGVAR